LLTVEAIIAIAPPSAAEGIAGSDYNDDGLLCLQRFPGGGGLVIDNNAVGRT
jgi:hypothetical protein